MMIRSLLTYGAVTLAALASLSFGNAQSSSGTYILKSARDQGRLGVSIRDVTADLKKEKMLSVEHGAYVFHVEEESPAEKAEIREGDVITLFDGEKVENADDLARMVRRTKPKRDVSVEIVRKGEHKVVTATIGREPGARAYSFNFGDHDFHAIPRILRIPRIPRFPRLPNSFGMLHRDFSTGEMLGLQVEELTKQLAGYFEVPGEKGVLVTEVEPGTAADTAGFKAGDVILKAGKNSVRHIEDLRDELMDRQEKKISVEILRKGKTLTLPLKLERDSEEEDEGMSGTSLMPRLGRSWSHDSHDRMSGYHEFTERTLEALREFLRELKSEVKNGLQELRQNLQTHFSTL